MGEVYRTRDTRLKRDVALKVLPQSVAHDPDRLARFQREAEALAALQHPSIAAIYGLEHADGTLAIAMELVEGETLADRIARGSIPFEEVRPLASQIADALGAAHEKGIIHRDLKPANIKLTASGGVKLLDFGLAKLASANDGQSPLASGMATVTSPALMTGAAVILGTAAYMSPEQARGRAVDKRTDVWAFGCVLFEMLSGRRAFDGEDVTETLGAVIHKEPDQRKLPTLPPAIPALLRACLQKDPRRRLRDAGDARLALEGSFDAEASSVSATSQRLTWRTVLAGVAAVLLTASVTSAIWWRHAPEADREIARFTVELPEGQQLLSNGLNAIAVSPDGKKVVYVTTTGASPRLWVRPIADQSARLIVEETDPIVGAPTFTSDGAAIVYWAGTGPQSGTFKRVRIDGGDSPIPMLKVGFPAGLSILGDSLIFATLQGEIMRAPVAGGTAERIIDVGRGLPWSPQLLPGGKTVLYTVARNLTSPSGASTLDWDQAEIVVQEIGSNTPRVLTNGTGARYLASGHIAYAVGGSLFVQQFDVKRLEMGGNATPVVSGIRRPVFFNATPGTVYFDVSNNGVLVYATGPANIGAIRGRIAVLTRQGKSTPLALPPNIYRSVRVSPDERYLLADIVTDDANSHLWLYELSGATSLRQLTVAGRNSWGIWSPDGQVAFQSDRDGTRAIYVQPADSSRGAERLTTPADGEAHRPLSWRHGQLLYEVAKRNESALWVMSIAERKAVPFGTVRSTSGLPISAEISPDGRWVAYSTSSGVSAGQLAIEPLPPTGSIYPIAQQAYNPVWSRDGSELLYQRRGQIEVVQIVPGTGFAFREAPAIPRGSMMPFRAAVGRQLDVMKDGKLIGVVGADGESGTVSSDLNVVLGWFNDLKALTTAR